MKICYLTGGIGGVKLLHGLTMIHPNENITAIVNTGDDMVHWGLHISPDVDTVVYTLAGLSDNTRGWGVKDETFQCAQMAGNYGLSDWFQLGDQDLAMHLARSSALRLGQSLTGFTKAICTRLKIKCKVLPMTDDPAPTIIETDEIGKLPFQDWLVKHQAKLPVQSVIYEGNPTPTGEVIEAITNADIVMIGPSNPYVSIFPIIKMPEIYGLLREKTVLAVSPIINGAAVKGPLAEMIKSLQDLEPSAATSLNGYGEILDIAICEQNNQENINAPTVIEGKTLMKSLDDRKKFATFVLDQLT